MTGILYETAEYNLTNTKILVILMSSYMLLRSVVRTNTNFQYSKKYKFPYFFKFIYVRSSFSMFPDIVGTLVCFMMQELNAF